MSASQTFVFTLLTKDLTREWVHMMNLPTHDAGNGLIGFHVLRNLVGDKTLNTELRVWAAVNEADHRGNKRLSLRRRFDMGQLTKCLSMKRGFARRAPRSYGAIGPSGSS
jgi:hypothetical protein